MTRFQTPTAAGRSKAFAIAVGFGLALIVVALAFVVLGLSGGQNNQALTAAIVLPLLPVAGLLTLRWPVIFPFGLWAGLLPFDLLLGVGAAGSIVRYVELGTVAVIGLRIIATRKMVVAPRSWFPWVMLVLWMTMTTLWSIGPAASQTALLTIVPLLLMLSVISVYPISVLEMRAVLISVVLGALGAAAYGYNLYTHGELSGDSRLTLMTQSGVVVDANFFATSFLLPIAICLSVVLAHRSVWYRLLAAGATFAMLGAIFLSGSRGAFVSVAVVVIFFAIRTRNRLATLAIACGAGLIFVAFPTMLRRLTEAQTNSSGSGRTFIWSVGAKALQSHWVGGTGVGTFPLAYDRAMSSVGLASFEGWSRPAHNVLVGTSVELGLIGAALVVFAWWSSFRQAATIGRASPNFPLRVAAEAAVLGLFVNALFIDPFMIKYFWLAFMIPIMLHNLELGRQVQKRRAVSTPYAAQLMRRAGLVVRRPALRRR